MANAEQVERLFSGIDAWNAWRANQPEHANIDLRGAELADRDLRGIDLNRANLGFADLQGAKLEGASLHRASLRSADLTAADLSGADLSAAALTDAQMRHVEMVGTRMTGAKLTRAALTSSDADRADFERANLRFANLRACSLSHTNFRRADLHGTDFSMAKLRESNLQEANLVEANLSSAEMVGADLSHARLGATILVGVRLVETRGFEQCQHLAGSFVDHRTVDRSEFLPDDFLRGCGLSDSLIKHLRESGHDHQHVFYSCFVSYSHEDKAFARRIHDNLQDRGIRCWLDEKQVLPGDDIYEQIDLGIKLWDKVLLCCSKSSLNSWWVDNEIDTAFEKERQLMKERAQKVLALVPLNLDGYLFDGWDGAKRQQLKSRVAADFTGWESNHRKFDAALEQLVSALKTENAGRERPPEPKL